MMNLFELLNSPQLPERIKQEAPKERDPVSRAARMRFIIKILYGAALRIEDLIELKEDCFRRTPEPTLKIKSGKGGKSASIPITLETWLEYKRYRESLNPGGKEPEHIMRCSSGISPIRTQTPINSDIKLVCRFMAADYPEESEKWTSVSSHWFRHSRVTHQVQKGSSLAAVQKFARHSSLSTTEKYVHLNDDDVRALLD
jgi:site-specific recombinase XerD